MEANALLVKAEQFIRSAVLLTENDDLDSAASRLYYAMFFTSEALLNKLDLTYSSHHAIIAAYGQHFAKTQRLDARFHRALISAFNMRQRGEFQCLHVEYCAKKDPVHLYAVLQWLERLKRALHSAS
jgi:uncharacterized protein (UPF0332 family)